MIKIFCHKHKDTHTLSMQEAAKAIHVYQALAAYLAYQPPLPRKEYSTPEVLYSTFCVKEDEEALFKHEVAPKIAIEESRRLAGIKRPRPRKPKRNPRIEPVVFQP